VSGKSKSRSSASKSKGERSSGSAKKRSGSRKRPSGKGKSSKGAPNKSKSKSKSKGKRSTGKQRAVSKPAAGGPSPAVAVGIAVAVLGMLGVALMIAMGGGGEAPQPSQSPLSSPTQLAAASPARVEPRPSEPQPSATPEASEPPTPGKVDRGEVKDLLAELEGDKDPPASAGADTGGEQASSQLKGEHEDVTVKRVVDGDTFVTGDGRKIRMIGINTPEKGRPFNKDATNFLKDLITGKTVTIEFGSEKKGRYGRYLAYVHMGDLFVSAEIVRRGLAYAYIYPKTKLHNEQLIQCQREARAAKRGLWSLPLPEPADHYIGNYRAPYFHREGCHRIKKLRKSNRRDYKTRNEALDAGMNPCVDCKS